MAAVVAYTASYPQQVVPVAFVWTLAACMAKSPCLVVAVVAVVAAALAVAARSAVVLAVADKGC